MPIYGEAKTRNMIRSVLPSTARKGARENRRLAHKRGRAQARETLHKYKGSAAAAEDIFDDDTADYEAYPDELIKDAMWDRRGADKLGPLMRWAAPKVKDVRPEDRRAWMLAQLPDNTIGRHAMSHVEFLDEFPRENPYEFGFFRPRWAYNPPTEAERAWADAARYAAAEARIRALLETHKGHKRLNRSEAAVTIEYFECDADYQPALNEEKFYSWWRYLDGKRVPGGWKVKAKVRRPLEGYHDIERFIAMPREHDSGRIGALERILDELGY